MLKSREKQLLRQVEAVHVQQLSLIQSNLEAVTCKPLLSIDLSVTRDLESQILDLGKLKVVDKNDMTVKDTEPYKVQEYQDADKDHESFNKSIKFEDKNNEIVEKFIDSKEICGINVSTSDESGATYNDSNLSCSCNSSFDSNGEIENRSNQESSVFSISNCTVIHKSIIFSNNEPLTKISTRAESLDSNSLSIDLINENLKTDLPIDVETCENFEEFYSDKAISKEITNSNFHQDINANKEQDSSKDSLSINKACKSGQIRRDSSEHPKQIQQWLQQILVETETEPMIHEIEQFSEISKVRLSGQFPLET